MEILAIVLLVLVALLVVLLVLMARLLGRTVVERDALIHDYDKLRRGATALASAAIRLRQHKSTISMGVIRQHELRVHETTTNEALEGIARQGEEVEIHLGLRKPRAVIPDDRFREVGEWTP